MEEGEEKGAAIRLPRDHSGKHLLTTWSNGFPWVRCGWNDQSVRSRLYVRSSYALILCARNLLSVRIPNGSVAKTCCAMNWSGRLSIRNGRNVCFFGHK